MPARWGVQQTTRAPGSNKTRGQGSFGPFTGGRKRRTDHTLDQFLLRQGKPGTSQYIYKLINSKMDIHKKVTMTIFGDKCHDTCQQKSADC